MTAIRIQYFSDILCIWAWVAERRVAELAATFGPRIEIETRFCSVFPDTRAKIAQNWAHRGGYEGFNRHLREVAEKFSHVNLHERVWLDARPSSSAGAHLFVKAVETFETPGAGMPYAERLSTRAASLLRHAFFAEARDISDWQVQGEIANALGLDPEALRARLASSVAVGALATDLHMAQQQNVTGSPTFIMNEGRQRLFGNVGYRLLEANVNELLRNPAHDQASWC